MLSPAAGCILGGSGRHCRVSMLDIGSSSEEEGGDDSARGPRFCNQSALAPGEMFSPSPALPFTLSKSWNSCCQQNLEPPSAAHWDGQNRCWEWIKQVGCYAQDWGKLSWLDAQLLTAESGKCPVPALAPMQPLRSPELCEHYNHGAALEVGEEEAQDARRWVNMHVNILVLNLLHDVERWEFISKRMAQLGLEISRVGGLDFTLPSAYTDAKRSGLIPMDYNYSRAQDIADTEFQDMHGIAGTMGCVAAHLNAMRYAVARSGERPLTLILEDDVSLEDDFAVKLRRLLEDEAPCDWVAISLKSKCPYGRCVSPRLTGVGPDGNEPEDRCRHGVDYGFYAMLYRSTDLEAVSQRLSETVWNETRPHCLDIDVALASISDQVAYYAVPGMQSPGFLTEGGHSSSRVINNGKADVVNLAYEDEMMHREARAKKQGLPIESCAVYGCIGYSPFNRCQCNEDCILHKSCCADHTSCITTTTATSTDTTTSTDTITRTITSSTTTSSTTRTSSTSSTTSTSPNVTTSTSLNVTTLVARQADKCSARG
mmetsp:Transcript_71256/g.231523  ORF Transcript_71256/g.231523 Transcript_71256/m.231523 type:complete len:542 (-) Transcript_71256:567-2192(-)